MRRRIIVGFALALIYATFVLLIPHDTPRVIGLESDLTMMYINGAAAVDNMFAGHWSAGQPNLLWPDINPFTAHGLGYPIVLWTFAWPFTDPVPAWSYFTAAKLVSILASMAVIVLTVLWLGWFPGCIAVVSLFTRPLFFRLSYSGCTDLFVVALLLWAAYCLFRQRFMVAGLLYALAVLSRYEYLILLPFVALLIVKNPTPKEALATADDSQVADAGLRSGLMLAGRTLASFLIPILVLLAANVHIVGMPAANRGNLAIHFLEEIQYGYQLTETVMEKYPSFWSILSADPGRTFNILTRDLWKTTAGLVTAQVVPVLFVGAVFCLFRRRDNRTWILFAALSAHYLALNVFMSQSVNERFFILEIIVLTWLGSSVFQHIKRWYLLALIPFLVLGLQQLGREINTQTQRNTDGFLVLREAMRADQTILSMRPQLAFVAGTHWHYWKPGIENIHLYCVENQIDYLLWSSQEVFHQREFRDKFSSSRSAFPEFSTVHADSNSGILFKVNRLQ